jgi:predicted RNA-binding protein YlqC (UPF0109 family)
MVFACGTSARRGKESQVVSEAAIRRVAAALLAFCKILVDHPDRVMISWSLDSEAGIVHYEARAHPDDVKFLVGKLGDTAEAIRDLLFAASGKARVSMRFQIFD